MTILKRILGKVKRLLGYKEKAKLSDPKILEKAHLDIERFREIISDPLNVFIERCPQSGFVNKDGYVFLHNGNMVPYSSRGAYYGRFSDILVINRGVHEPLEEFCFQKILKNLKGSKPVMLELGSYWGHYSMWLKKQFFDATCFLVESDPHNLETGKRNFDKNGFKGNFILSFVGDSGFKVDDFLDSKKTRLDILHSDIQGFELEMLDGSRLAFKNNLIDYVFISTHSQELHDSVVNKLEEYNYRVEVSSGFNNHTTSFDGFVLASSKLLDPVFDNFYPMGRQDILNAKSCQFIEYIQKINKCT